MHCCLSTAEIVTGMCHDVHDTVKTVLSITRLSRNFGSQQTDKGRAHPRTGHEGPGVTEI